LKLKNKGLSGIDVISSQDIIDLSIIPLIYKLPFDNHHSNLFSIFAQYVNNEITSFPSSFESSLQLMNLIYSIYLSNFENKEVSIDLNYPLASNQFKGFIKF
jgi:hypothetical protein